MTPPGGRAPYITPSTSAIVARARAAALIDYAAMPLTEGRRVFDQMARFWNEQPPDVHEVRDLSVAGATGPMRSRLYRPRPDAPLPVILYVHGGGWTFGNIDTHDRCMRLLALESGACVLGFDYRLGPEHPYPAAVDDTLAGLDWLAHRGTDEGVDPARIALAGDSAGANIALATLITARERGRRLPLTAALFYGCYAPLFDTSSHRRFGGGDYILSTARMRWFWRNWLGALPENAPSLAAPLHADLAGLPPLFLNAAGLDPLLDDSVMLGMRLAHAGTPCEIDIVPGVLHGFLQHSREEPAASVAIRRAARYLRDRLSS